MTTFSVSIAANGDDGLEAAIVSTWFNDIGGGGANPFGYDATGGVVGIITRLHAGVRFLSVTVPNASTINSATITLRQYRYSGTTTPSGTWKAVNADNAGQFGGATLPSGASGTTANTAWVSDASATPVTVQHDVTSIVQEIVNRGGWSSGNAINFYCLADVEASTSIDQWDDYTTTSGTPALLEIDYTVGGGTAVPVFMNHLRTQGIA